MLPCDMQIPVAGLPAQRTEREEAMLAYFSSNERVPLPESVYGFTAFCKLHGCIDLCPGIIPCSALSLTFYSRYEALGLATEAALRRQFEQSLQQQQATAQAQHGDKSESAVQSDSIAVAIISPDVDAGATEKTDAPEKETKKEVAGATKLERAKAREDKQIAEVNEANISGILTVLRYTFI